MIRVDKLDLQRSLPPFTKQVDDLRVRCLVKVAVMRANSVERFGQDQAHHLVALMAVGRRLRGGLHQPVRNWRAMQNEDENWIIRLTD